MAVGRPKSVRKIDATPIEWATAHAKWEERLNTGQTFSNALDNEQMGMYLKLIGNIKAMNGEPVLLISESSGDLLRSYPFRMSVLGVHRDYDSFTFTLGVHSTEENLGRDNLLENIHPYSVLPVINISVPDEAQLKEARFQEIIEQINRNQKSHLELLDVKRRDLERRAESIRRDLAHTESTLKTTIEQMRTDKTPTLSKEDVIKMFENLRKHRKVENAYLNAEGFMIVETKNLYATDRQTLKENKSKPIGRFVFLLNNAGIEYCRIENIDYCRHSGRHYQHPNVRDQRLCTGDNTSEFNNMVKKSSFYELTDALILFLSLWPHDGGTPYMSPDIWMKNIIPEPKINPWFIPEPLWSLKPVKKTVKMKKPAKKPIDILREAMARPQIEPVVQLGGTVYDTALSEETLPQAANQAGVVSQGMVSQGVVSQLLSLDSSLDSQMLRRLREEAEREAQAAQTASSSTTTYRDDPDF